MRHLLNFLIAERHNLNNMEKYKKFISEKFPNSRCFKHPDKNNYYCIITAENKQLGFWYSSEKMAWCRTYKILQRNANFFDLE